MKKFIYFFCYLVSVKCVDVRVFFILKSFGQLFKALNKVWIFPSSTWSHNGVSKYSVVDTRALKMVVNTTGYMMLKMPLWSRLVFFYPLWMSCLSIGLWVVIKSRYYRTIGDVQHNDWITTRIPNTFLKRNCTKRRWWLLFGGLLSVWSTTAFWILVKHLWEWNTVNKSMKWIRNCSIVVNIGKQKGANSST